MITQAETAANTKQRANLDDIITPALPSFLTPLPPTDIPPILVQDLTNDTKRNHTPQQPTSAKRTQTLSTHSSI
jgi:hypothetical protein